MSANDEEKVEAKYPLDLAAKISSSKAATPADGGKATTTPLLLPTAPLRTFRIIPQAPAASTTSVAAGGTTIITNLVQGEGTRNITGIINTAPPQASGSITVQRHITLPVVGQTPSHLPRGASVVANLSAPRSNVAGAIRGPLVVTAATGGQGFMRPARTPSPAQGGATWISTSNANGSQVKGVPAAVLSTARAASITAGKPTPVVAKTQVNQIVSTIKPNTTILQSAIIGQNQLQFKNAVPGIQTLNTAVTLAQVVPARTQTLVYTPGTPGFALTPRLTVASPAQRGQSGVTTRPIAQVMAARLPVPVTVSATRILAPHGAVLTSTARITTIPASQPAATNNRIISTQGNVSLGKTVAVTNASTTVTPILTQMRSALVVPTTTANRSGNVHAVKGAQSAQAIPLQLTSMPASAMKNTHVGTPRTLNSQTTITQRPTAVVSSHAMGINKAYSSQDQPTSLYVQTSAAHSTTRRSSPGPPLQQAQSVPTTSVATYPFYDSGGGYPRTFGQPGGGGTTITPISQAPSALRQNMQLNSAGQMNRFNPIMVANEGRGYDRQDNQDGSNVNKITSSPRPSILRKREHDSNTPLKAAKNLMSSLSNLQPPLSPPSRPDSRNNGHSSGGSTTISATSSPGLADANEDSNQHMPMNKEEEENRPPLEMSPRKKPRKQNLAGNDLDENDDDMQFISERDIKRDQDDSDGMHSDGPQDGAPESRRVANVRKPASASLLNYMQRYKATNNHYQRYSDVRPKDERRPTIIEMSNQHRVLEKVNGWKIHHLSTQMEDLAEEEHSVHSQLSDILKFTDKQDLSNPEINRITELIKGNMQRVKIIKDGMIDANSAIMKIFDHKVHVTDIINRCASKRNYKKREKT